MPNKTTDSSVYRESEHTINYLTIPNLDNSGYQHTFPHGLDLSDACYQDPPERTYLKRKRVLKQLFNVISCISDSTSVEKFKDEIQLTNRNHERYAVSVRKGSDRYHIFSVKFDAQVVAVNASELFGKLYRLGVLV